MAKRPQVKIIARQSRGGIKKRDRSKTEARLLKAAEEIFSKHGFNGTTTRMIAEKAKANESLIARYFNGKTGLFFAIIKEHIENIPLQELDYTPQNNAKDEVLNLLIMMYRRHSKKNQNFFKIVLSKSLTDPKFMKQMRKISPQTIHPEAKARFDRLQKLKKIKADVDINQFLDNLNTSFNGIMLFDKILMDFSEPEIEKRLHFVTETYANFIEL